VFYPKDPFKIYAYDYELTLRWIRACEIRMEHHYPFIWIKQQYVVKPDEEEHVSLKDIWKLN
jgi:hypothetical protein